MEQLQQSKLVREAGQCFSGKIYPVMAKSLGSDSNVIASPFSLHTVLTMLLMGADGKTAEELRKVLALPVDEQAVSASFAATTTELNKTDGSFTLECANRLFVHQNFAIVGSYLEATSKAFNASAGNVDFAESEAARKTINGWIEEKTHDKIKDLIAPGVLNHLTRLVLVNAIYFKGVWNVPFNKALTQTEDFQVTKSKTVKAPMMNLTSDFKLAKVDQLKARVLMLPYKGKRLAMLIFLPDRAADFEAMESKFSGYDFELLDSLLSRPRKVEVSLPKFRIESTHPLNDSLKTIGLNDMFVAGKADFTKLSEAEKRDKNLFVAVVIQKAFVEVNEEGTEAAAATAAVLQLRSMAVRPDLPEVFRCDRPFMFAIRDYSTGIVLFVGRVVNPLDN